MVSSSVPIRKLRLEPAAQLQTVGCRKVRKSSAKADQCWEATAFTANSLFLRLNSDYW